MAMDEAFGGSPSGQLQVAEQRSSRANRKSAGCEGFCRHDPGEQGCPADLRLVTGRHVETPGCVRLLATFPGETRWNSERG